MVDSYIIDLPTINILNYLNSEPILKYRDLSEEDKFIIDEAIKNNMTKTEILNKFQITSYRLQSILDKYEEIKPGITETYNKSTKEGQRQKLYDSAMERSAKATTANNNLYKIKLERNLTTKDISNLCNGKIGVLAINLIIEGKTKNPKLRTKKIISEALGMKVEEVFPEN